MKSKLDKDTLIKHHYWLVAAAALLVALGAIFMLKTSVRAGIDKKKKDLNTAFSSVQGTPSNGIPSRATIDKWKEFADSYKAQEEVAWREVFEAQEPYLRFSREIEKEYHFTRDPVSKQIGFFATEIAILAGDAALPESTDTGNTFSGVVKTRAQDRISVAGSLIIEKKVPKKKDVLIDEEKKDEEKKDEEKKDEEKKDEDKKSEDKKDDDKKSEEGKKAGEPPVVEKKAVEEFDIEKVKVDDKTFDFFKAGNVKVTKPGGGDVDAFFRDINVGDKVTVTFDRGRYFMEPLTREELTLYESSYYKQFEEIVRQVNPVDPDGRGVVQLLQGNTTWPVPRDEWEMPEADVKFIRFLNKKDFDPVADWSEKAWLSQEDIWVYREMFRLVDQANFYVREFRRNKEIKDAWVGQNAYWEAELKIPEAGKFTVKLKNLLSRRQSLGVVLNVWFKDSKAPERVTVAGESARDARGGAKDTSAVKEFEIDGGDLGPIERVEQELSWDLAAVKRIDEIAIGMDTKGTSAHSHRTYPTGVKPFKEEPKPEGGGAGGMGGMGPMGDPMGMRPPVFGKKDDGIGGGAGVVDTKVRYSEVTTQGRKLPIAITLIVDQQHVDRVQISFGNSKLRFLTTQVLMNRYPYSVNPRTSAKDDKADKNGPGSKSSLGPVGPPGMPPAIRPPPGSGKRPPGGDIPMPGFPMGDFGGGDYGGRSEENESNVELTIYGFITIYERFPPKAKSATPAGS